MLPKLRILTGNDFHHGLLKLARERSAKLVNLDDALQALMQVDERNRVVEMRFFGGMSVEETAEALAVSRDTVLRDWRLAKVWLMREMRRQPGDVT
jgi:RNA polymerase sigma-70 factor, ECF subfamily